LERGPPFAPIFVIAIPVLAVDRGYTATRHG
jgi:hypothetical protein